ncbi:hypothetical protein BDZ97DRAFT_1757188 [Flammula alnicola]|nr:hypothetical protein BDZ97DRAFT_1757188 [Flammula alnicola]
MFTLSLRSKVFHGNITTMDSKDSLTVATLSGAFITEAFIKCVKWDGMQLGVKFHEPTCKELLLNNLVLALIFTPSIEMNQERLEASTGSRGAYLNVVISRFDIYDTTCVVDSRLTVRGHCKMYSRIYVEIISCSYISTWDDNYETKTITLRSLLAIAGEHLGSESVVSWSDAELTREEHKNYLDLQSVTLVGLWLLTFAENAG